MAYPHTAIFGGTFDPVHNGHLRMATEMIESLHCEELRLVPAGIPPHREANQVAAHHRLAMLNLAVKDEEKLCVDSCELKREGPSYSIDTVKDIRQVLGDDRAISFCMGVDAFSTLQSWQDWQQLSDYVHIVVVTRPGFYLPKDGPLFDWWQERAATDVDDLLTETKGRVLNLELTPLSISSSDLRQRVVEHKSVRYLVPKAVQNYIEQYALYK